jgi:hypothetical protein
VDKTLKSRSRLWAARISILTVLPLLALKLVFLADVQGWFVALAYGLIVLVVPAAIICLLGCLAIESHLRTKHLTGFQRFPWFKPIVAAALLTFFYVGEWAKPVVKVSGKSSKGTGPGAAAAIDSPAVRRSVLNKLLRGGWKIRPHALSYFACSSF